MTRIYSFILLFMFCCSANSELLPVEAFANLPQVSQVKLSPNGKQIAFMQNSDDLTLLGVFDLDTKQRKFLVKTDNEKFKLSWYRWANDEVLLISGDYPVQIGVRKYSETRLLKVNVDGSTQIESVLKPKSAERHPQFQNNIIDTLPEEPDHILMALDLKVANQPDVYKINLNSTRVRSMVYRGKQNIYDWMTDRQHRLRLGFGRDKTKIFYRLFDLKTEQWRNIWEYEIFDAPDISPLGFGKNPNDLYIRANHEQRYAIFKVDLSKADLPSELVYADSKYDVEGALIYSAKTNDVIGVYHGEANEGKIYFDAKYSKFQQALNKSLPDAYNNIASFSADERKYILYSSNATEPGVYYLGDRDNKGLTFIFERYPLLYQQPLSGKEKITYKASDGLDIEGYVTLPHTNVKNRNAAIIIPHGGPMARNYAGFDWFSEFFASRGYTVLEPNFRGSSGYGFEFEMAAIQQWGGAMQDDLQDGAHWLTSHYKIDKDRVCILGASYGGYAAIMAAVKQQQTFRCAASIAGVMDLELILSRARQFTNNEVVKKQFGTDSDKLEDNSPINFAEQINIPIMLIHGNKDRVVDVEHSRDMFDELLDYDKKVEYIELENGNHHLEIQSNRVKTMQSLERFLATHLNSASD